MPDLAVYASADELLALIEMCQGVPGRAVRFGVGTGRLSDHEDDRWAIDAVLWMREHQDDPDE